MQSPSLKHSVAVHASCLLCCLLSVAAALEHCSLLKRLTFHAPLQIMPLCSSCPSGPHCCLHACSTVQYPHLSHHPASAPSSKGLQSVTADADIPCNLCRRTCRRILRSRHKCRHRACPLCKPHSVLFQCHLGLSASLPLPWPSTWHPGPQCFEWCHHGTAPCTAAHRTSGPHLSLPKNWWDR